ncbi:MAG TPA: hypothetical protein VGN72_06075 [Tepidisphaeraceae bacterium]|nr:hypothetical protein [Tepidisphaeraceae bacterium]
MSGHLALHHRDYRLLPQDPALFSYLAGLRAGDDRVQIDRSSPLFTNALNNTEAQWALAIDTLYKKPAAPPDALLQRARLPFVVVAVIGGLAAAIFAYALGGPVAAMVTAGLFAFDPNLLAHAPLVKNDVPLAAMFAIVIGLTWWVGRRVSVALVALLALACAVAINVKLSGVLLIVMVGLLLAGRAALLRADWHVLGRNVRSRRWRIATCAGILFATGLVCWATTWAVYGFRYSVAPDAQVTAGWDALERAARAGRAQAAHPDRPVTAADLESQPVGTFATLVRWAAGARLLPEAWLYGLQFVQTYAIVRSSFLLGETTLTGHWYYFPLAMAFKTPTAVLAAAVVIPTILLYRRLRRSNSPPTVRQRQDRTWALLCLSAPVVVYSLISMTTSLNLGIRHMLPVYPLLYVAIACGVAQLVQWNWKAINLLLTGLVVVLVAESALAWPNYIPFFNAPSGGARGGMKLLSDSNLDWGQDLKLLAEWQQRNPNVKLYLCYFGSADPAAYGIRRVELPGGWQWTEWTGDLREPGVIAVSATNLQGTYLPPQFHRFYKSLAEQQQPLEILGESIYLYAHPGRP